MIIENFPQIAKNQLYVKSNFKFKMKKNLI